MKNINTLPKINKKKRIEAKRFEALAKKVKKYFEEEVSYIRNKNADYGNNQTSRFTISS